MKAVTEAELKTILELRETREALREREQRLTRRLERLEARIIIRLDEGAQVRGGIAAAVKVISRVCPAWREAFERLAKRFGRVPEVEVAKVRARTEPTITKELVLTKGGAS